MIKINKLKRALGLTGMCLLLSAVGVQAATLTVNTTADGGAGSLRQAIIDATTNAEANTISFTIPTTDPGYNAVANSFTISLLGQLPDIPLAPMTISNTQPQSLIVKGNNSFRIFTLVDSAVLTITNLTVTNGYSGGSIPFSGSDRSSKGGRDSILTAAPDGVGGGIYMGNSSTLNLNSSTVSNNTATDNGGSIYMSDSGTLNINQSTLSSNTATNGGGVYINISGTVNMSNSTVSGNVANNGGSGGGLFNNTSGTINAHSSTISGNSASSSGGGIYNTATITLTGNTISSNSAASGGGVYNNFTATLNNNLVALNAAVDGNDLLGRGSLGNAYSGTYNLIGNADGSEGIAGGTNQIGTTAVPVNPMLGPLQNNGGPTLTRELLTGSPAIDMGSSPAIVLDQRGRNRPYDNLMVANASGGNGSDVGAFEAQLAPTAASASITGKVSAHGKGLASARVELVGTSGAVRMVMTNSFGNFTISNVGGGATYIVVVSAKKYTFAPQIVSVTDNVSGLTFAAQ